VFALLLIRLSVAFVAILHSSAEMKQNVLVPATFLFLAWHVGHAYTSCAQNTYKVKDFQDVIAIDWPYIVSNASDWNYHRGDLTASVGWRYALAELVSLKTQMTSLQLR